MSGRIHFKQHFRKGMTIGLTAILAAGLSACGSDSGLSDGSGIKISAATRTLQDTTYIQMRNTAQKIAAQDGVDFTWLDCNINAGIQKEQLENIAADGTDVLILEGADQTSLSRTAEVIQANGIPVIVMEALIDGFTPDLWITSDSYQVGRDQVDSFVEEYGADKEGNVALLSGTQGDQVAETISAGVREELKKYPKLTLVYEQSCEDWARDKSMQAMEDCISRTGGNIAGVFGNNDQIAMGALKACENSGIADQIWFIGADAEEEMLRYIEDGYHVKTIFKGFDAEGRELIRAGEALAKGEEVEGAMVVNGVNTWYVPTTVVGSDNSREFLEKYYS